MSWPSGKSAHFHPEADLLEVGVLGLPLQPGPVFWVSQVGQVVSRVGLRSTLCNLDKRTQDPLATSLARQRTFPAAWKKFSALPTMRWRLSCWALTRPRPPLLGSGLLEPNGTAPGRPRGQSMGEKHREQLGITDIHWDLTSLCPAQAWGNGDGAPLSQPCLYLEGLSWGPDPLADDKSCVPRLNQGLGYGGLERHFPRMAI